MFESELFGAAKGAYTGTVAEHEGLVEIANGGTLFLDEVDSFSCRAQVALLRFRREHEYRRVGSGPCRRSDVRLVPATNVDIEDCVETARFRMDLLFRLGVFSLQVPSLAERRSDTGHRREAERLSVARRPARQSRIEAPLGPKSAGRGLDIAVGPKPSLVPRRPVDPAGS